MVLSHSLFGIIMTSRSVGGVYPIWIRDNSLYNGCENKPSDIDILSKIGKRDGKRSLDIAPVQILPYSAGKRTSPGRVIMNEGTVDSLTGIQNNTIRKGFAWRIYRQPVDTSLFQFKEEQQRIPGWARFNGIVCKQDIPRKSVVGYCQVIDASPTELSTVYTLLTKSVAMGKDIGVEDIMAVLDWQYMLKQLLKSGGKNKKN